MFGVLEKVPGFRDEPRLSGGSAQEYRQGGSVGSNATKRRIVRDSYDCP